MIERLVHGVQYAILFAFLWWVLSEGNVAAWGLGIPAVATATVLSLLLAPGKWWRWRLGGLLRFLPFFLRHSFTGSLDVARRAVQRPLPLHPMLLDYAWRLPPGPARIFFANVVNLLPGTLSAELQDEGLTVHVIDGRISAAAELQELESRVAALFGLHMGKRGPEDHPHA